jgi:hypothetical protein
MSLLGIGRNNNRNLALVVVSLRPMKMHIDMLGDAILK